ncbi:MAG: hypothetical protein IJD86_05790 [Clostridia bacterium]|nr:hypothetical protein [Clostridia bacterium]
MFLYDEKRVKNLRDKAVAPFICYDEFYLYFYRYLKSEKGSIESLFGNAWEYAFRNIHPSISKDELIVGKSDYRLTEDEQKEYDLYKDTLVRQYAYWEGQDSHMAVDFELVLEKGIDGILSDIDVYLQNADEEKRIFYNACKSALNGVLAFSETYSKEALRQMEEETDPTRKKELLLISEITSHVPRFPARTFHEAVQCVHFIAFALSYSPLRPYSMQQFQLGRPDRYLYPYYRRDIESGTLTTETAQTLIDLLAIQINNRVPHGLSSGYMVGGYDKTGRLVSNELTHMFLQAIDDVHLVYPSVGLCYTPDTPETTLSLAMDILAKGRSHPAIFNDRIITEGLISYGVDEDEAHDYIHSTCVEITPIASSNVWVASPYTNMLALLLNRMDREYSSFDDLFSLILSDLDASIFKNFNEQNEFRKIRKIKCRHPLLSCFVNDCLKNGLDIECGGARYNWIMPSFVGMGNLIDSLYALKKVVFESKLFTIAQIKKALDANFEGYEPLRQMLLNRIDKYGNDVDEVDEMFVSIVTHIVSECKKHTPVLPNARLIPSVFCWVMHEQFGRNTPASPDGRKAGFPLGDGSGPCQGREKNGPTASILSSTKWPHTSLIGGVAVNMKFSKKTFTNQSSETVKHLIKTYIDRGGFEIQLNVVDRETLLKAQANPDEYIDLVVRIGGYSDYFVRISPEMQAEVIERTSHEV